jgi:large subunit ribosomal protein L25
MAQVVQLVAEPRTARKKKLARALRKTGKVPAILYGHGRAPRTLAVGGAELTLLLGRVSPESTIIELAVDGQVVRALIREIQRHPLRPGIVHVVFQEILAGEKVRIEIPVHLVGTPEGVHNQGGVLDQVLRTVEIEVLPADIPERVELDVSALVIGKSLHVSDLSILRARILSDPTATVATVVPPRVEEAPVVAAPVEGAVAEAPVEAVAEPEVIKRGKTEEEEPAEE